jgi:hypothetical protein
MPCSIPDLLRQACANDFDKVAEDAVLTRGILLQLLCNMSEGGIGNVDIKSGNYGGNAPTWIPSGDTGIAFDTSTGDQWNYYSGAWH